MKLDFFNIVALLAILTVIVLIIHRLYLIYYEITHENFAFSQCEFKASGNSQMDCINKCHLPGCSYLNCERICNKCVDEKERCPWDPEVDLIKGGTRKKGLSKVSIANKTPSEPKIGVSATYGKAKIYFKRPDSKKIKINGYVYYLFKTFNKNEGVKMGLMPNKKCVTCEKVFDKLDPDTAYSLSVRGYNQNGLGKMSNIVMFKPVDKFVAKDYSLDPAISKFTENYEMCE
tara:strand:+ start:195 stop:887 length:693 start_codon:yes stop_codon:yes gene_type:complete